MRRDGAATTSLACALWLLSACSRSAPRSDSCSPPCAKSSVSAAEPLLRGDAAPSDVAAPPSDAEVSASGMASRQLRAGLGGAPPKLDDCVRLRYAAWKRDGSRHGGTTDRDPSATHCLRRTLPGLAEALQRMSVGEERRIWLPGRLTYRSTDPSQPAPANDLTLDITLLEILSSPPVPADLLKPPDDALTTASGLRLRVLEPGIGPRRARPNERMSVRLSGWTRDGVLFESTALGAGKPASVSRADVARGVGEALSLMQIGERARAWLPARLAFGEKPRRGAPSGDLVYDLELLSVESAD